MSGKKCLSVLYLTSAFVLLFASSALAAKRSNFFSVAGGDLLGFIAAIDGILIAVAVFKIYHRIFSVFYFSVKAILMEIFWIAMIGGGLLMVTGYAYFIAIFLLMTGLAKKFWNARKNSES